MNCRFPISNFQFPRVPAPPGRRVRSSPQSTIDNRQSAVGEFAQHSALSTQHFTARAAFSFTEILFAIMILGIGFIMVAAMFPVALSQTETSAEETVGASVAKQGAAYVAQLARMTWISSYDPSRPVSVPRDYDNSWPLTSTQLLVPDWTLTTANPQFPGQSFSLLRPTVLYVLNPAAVPPNPPLPATSTPNPTMQWDNWTLWNHAAVGYNDLVAQFPTFPTASGAIVQTIPGQMWSLNADMRSNITTSLDFITGRDITGAQQTPLGAHLWALASQNMIQPTDTRYAWIAFYKRDLIEELRPSPILGGMQTVAVHYAPYAQVVVIAVQARNVSNYGPADVKATDPLGLNGVVPCVALQPTLDAGASLQSPVNGELSATILFAPGGPSTKRAAEGAFIVIADDNIISTNPLHGSFNGHVYRLGIQSTDPATPFKWEFSPAYGLTPRESGLLLPAMVTASGGNLSFSVYIVGRAPDPDDARNFSGAAQDIAVYNTFVPCPPY